MDSSKLYEYYVIEFASPPYPDRNRFVFIPNSWIQLREIENQTVVVKYPVEKQSLTKKRVKKGATYSEHWPMYVAYVIYGTDRYEDAKKHMKQMNSDFRKRSHTSDTEDDECSETSKNNLRFKRNYSSNNQEVANKILLGKPLSAAETAGHINKEYTRSPSKLLALLANKNDNKSQPNCEKSLIVKINTLPNFNKKPINGDHIQESNNPTTENKSTGNHKTPESTNILLSPQPSFEISVMSLMNKLLDSIEGSRTILNKLVNIFNDRIPIDRNDVVGSSEDTAAAWVPKENENEVIEIEDETEIVSPKETERVMLKITKGNNGVLKRKSPEIKEGSEENQISPQKPRRYSFTLPPDYDENDTKWTLRYREPGPELIELVKYSGIYVNEVRLRCCKRLSTDSKTLARKLFAEVFSDSALRTCSLDKRPQSLGGMKRRPRFDENARTVLFNYVDEYASKNNWAKLDEKSILVSLRNKMNHIRMLQRARAAI